MNNPSIIHTEAGGDGSNNNPLGVSGDDKPRSNQGVPVDAGLPLLPKEDAVSFSPLGILHGFHPSPPLQAFSPCDQQQLQEPPSKYVMFLRRLLYPFEWLFVFIFIGSILPSDDFIMRARKAAIGGLLLGFFGQAGHSAIMWSTSTMTVRIFLLCTVVLPMGVTHLAGFIYCRVKKSAPDWLFATVLLSATACRCCLATTNRSMDMEPASFAFVVIVLSMRMHVGVETAVVALTVLCLAINTINMEVPALGTAFVFPGVEVPTGPELFKHLVGSRLAFIIKTIGFFIIHIHFHGLLVAKESAVKVSRELAERLQKYDTAGAWNILRGRHEVDPDLLKAFEGIVANLERYRAFLPNYVLDTSDPALEQPSEPLSTSERLVPGMIMKEHVGAANTSMLQLKPRGLSFSGVKALDGSNNVSDPSTTMTDSFKDVIVRVNSCSGPGTLLCVNTPPPPPISTVEAFAAAVAPGVPLSSNLPRVSVVVMSVQRHNHDDTAAVMWNEFVGIVNDVAQTTGASLHSFLGDQLVATWNGTKRISKPETRACQFALRVRGSVTESVTARSAFRIASVVGTHPAECCFAGDARLRLFACSSPELWRHTRAALSRVGHLHISAADYATKEAAEYDIEFSAAALLKCPHQALEQVGQAAWLQRRCLYELVQERTIDAQTDQEWMYALQQSASNPNQQLVHSMELFALGRMSEAHTKLALLQRAHAELFERTAALELLQDLQLCGNNDDPWPDGSAER